MPLWKNFIKLDGSRTEVSFFFFDARSNYTSRLISFNLTRLQYYCVDIILYNLLTINVAIGVAIHRIGRSTSSGQ